MMGPPGWAGFFYEVEMNLKDMRDMVGNILDYNPNVAAYNTELNRIINDTASLGKVESEAKFEGKQISMIIQPI